MRNFELIKRGKGTNLVFNDFSNAIAKIQKYILCCSEKRFFSSFYQCKCYPHSL